MTGSNPPAAIRRLRADVSEPCRRRPVPAVSQIEHLEPREVFERKPPAAVREVEYGDDFIPMHQHVRVAEAPRQEWSVPVGFALAIRCSSERDLGARRAIGNRVRRMSTVVEG